MNIEYILPLMTFWHTITTQIVKYKSPEIANNAVSFIHCVLFIGHYSYEYNLNYTVHASIAFFIYDLFYIIQRIRYFDPSKRMSECNKQLPFIAHHIAGIYILYSSITVNDGENILGAYILLEKSNIMIYISYYLHKDYADYIRLNALSEVIQLIIYTYFRIFELSFFIHKHQDYLFSYPLITQILIWIVYSMGYAWSYRLLKKNIHNYYTLKGNKSNIQ